MFRQIEPFNRTGYIINQTGERLSFQFRYVDNKTLQRNDILKGIEMQQGQILIATKSSYKFSVKTKILIDEKQYSVDNIKIDIQLQEANGMFVKSTKKITYLTIQN